MMKKHKMKVKEPYFSLLRDGKKTIELRLFDEKRRKINVGDEITFVCFENEERFFISKVVRLYKANSFNELCSQFDCLKAGFVNKEELICVLSEFYSAEMQEKNGVVGIEIG